MWHWKVGYGEDLKENGRGETIIIIFCLKHIIPKYFNGILKISKASCL